MFKLLVLLQTDPEGDISITRLSFVPSESDDGKVLLCWAENPHLAAAGGAVEDRWKIEVQCKNDCIDTCIEYPYMNMERTKPPSFSSPDSPK